MRRHKSEIPATDKFCPSCSTIKPLSEFHKDVKNKWQGVSGYCRECARTKARNYAKRNTERIKKYRIDNKEKIKKRWKDWSSKNKRDSHIQRCRRYGITQQQYWKIFEEQNGVCAICKTPPNGRKLDIDHCHESGKVRALLCPLCNSGLGHFKESTELLLKAVSYLEEHK